MVYGNCNYTWLVLWNIFLFFHILGISSSQLTNSIIFQRGRYTTNQYTMQDPLVVFGLIENHVFSSIRATRLQVVGFVYRWLEVTVALPSGRNEVLHAMVTAMDFFFPLQLPRYIRAIRAQGYRHV